MNLGGWQLILWRSAVHKPQFNGANDTFDSIKIISRWAGGLERGRFEDMLVSTKY